MANNTVKQHSGRKEWKPHASLFGWGKSQSPPGMWAKQKRGQLNLSRDPPVSMQSSLVSQLVCAFALLVRNLLLTLVTPTQGRCCSSDTSVLLGEVWSDWGVFGLMSHKLTITRWLSRPNFNIEGWICFDPWLIYQNSTVQQIKSKQKIKSFKPVPYLTLQIPRLINYLYFWWLSANYPQACLILFQVYCDFK